MVYSWIILNHSSCTGPWRSCNRRDSYAFNKLPPQINVHVFGWWLDCRRW